MSVYIAKSIEKQQQTNQQNIHPQDDIHQKTKKTMPEEARSMKRYPPSGISVLVVGGGIGGLTCAIEAYRKGHDVRLVERRLNFFDRGMLQ